MFPISKIKILTSLMLCALTAAGLLYLHKQSRPLTINPVTTTPSTNNQANSAPTIKSEPEAHDEKILIGTHNNISYYLVSTRIGSGGFTTPRNIELDIIRSVNNTTNEEKDLEFLPIELSYTKSVDDRTWQPHGEARIKDGHIHINVYSAQSYIRPNQERLPIQINKIALPNE
jgi:hypothetical protein